MFDEQPDGDPHGECAAEIHTLQALVSECRSSVKFDLLHYEKMARAYGNIGPEGKQIHAAAESEAQRLHELLGKIDALMTPNYGPDNPPRLRKLGESLDEYRAAMGWPTETPNDQGNGPRQAQLAEGPR